MTIIEDKQEEMLKEITQSGALSKTMKIGTNLAKQARTFLDVAKENYSYLNGLTFISKYNKYYKDIRKIKH